MNILVSVIFKVEDHGDGTQITPTTSEVPRSTMHYIPDYVDGTNGFVDFLKISESVDHAIGATLFQHKRDLNADDKKANKVRIYSLISHSVLKL